MEIGSLATLDQRTRLDLCSTPVILPPLSISCHLQVGQQRIGFFPVVAKAYQFQQRLGLRGRVGGNAERVLFVTLPSTRCRIQTRNRFLDTSQVNVTDLERSLLSLFSSTSCWSSSGDERHNHWLNESPIRCSTKYVLATRLAGNPQKTQAPGNSGTVRPYHGDRLDAATVARQKGVIRKALFPVEKWDTGLGA